MTAPREEFQTAAPGYQRIGWQGMALLLPDDWNLRLHHGDERAGALVFADLGAPRLELRWRTPRRMRPLFGRGVAIFPGILSAKHAQRGPSPAGHGTRRSVPGKIAAPFGSNAQRLLDKTVALLKKRHVAAKVERLSSAAVRISDKEDTLLLAADERRVYELRWPALQSSERVVGVISDDFLRHLSRAGGESERFWSIYGACGWVPAKAKLQKVSLLPGAATLRFKYRGGTMALGAFSMADRLLGQAGSIRQWASGAIGLVGRFPGGHWEESDQEALFIADGKRRLRAARHMLRFCHDPAANRITWTHHFGPILP